MEGLRGVTILWKGERPASGEPPGLPDAERTAFEQQITELKLSVDSLEKERDYYFAKLRDIEILCQSAYAESLPVEEIKRILYAEDDDSMVVADAPAIISDNHQEMQPLGTMLEEAEHEPEGDCNEEKYYQY